MVNINIKTTRGNMTNKETKELIQDLYDMSCIDDQIKDLIKEIKCEDDVEHCAYLIHLRDRVKETTKGK